MAMPFPYSFRTIFCNGQSIALSKKVGEDASNEAMEERMRKMKEDRDSDIKTITGNKPPMSF